MRLLGVIIMPRIRVAALSAKYVRVLVWYVNHGLDQLDYAPPFPNCPEGKPMTQECKDCKCPLHQEPAPYQQASFNLQSEKLAIAYSAAALTAMSETGVVPLPGGFLAQTLFTYASKGRRSPFR